MLSENIIETDILVIGGGIAGCFAAISAKDKGLNVTIVDKAATGKSGASIGANAAIMVFNPKWGADFNECIKTLVTRGEYINNREWGEIVLNESLAVWNDLISWGTRFPADSLDNVNTWPPFTDIHLPQRVIPHSLRKKVQKIGVQLMDRIMITDLLKQDGKIIGAVGFPADSYDFYVFNAKATVLCGGGSSFKPAGFQIAELTGDAEGMAYRAGAEITGKEFPSTHSIWADNPAWRCNRSSITAFPYYTNAVGERSGFQGSAHGEPGLYWDLEVHAGKGPIFWDINTATDEDIQNMYKLEAKRGGICPGDRAGFDVSLRGRHRLAGGSSAGYCNVGTAGIWIYDNKCTTSLSGLFVAGDCCGTRINGSFITNPGLGTMPSAISGRRAGEGAAEYALNVKNTALNREVLQNLRETTFGPINRNTGFSPRWIIQLVQNAMMPYFIFLVKHGDRLNATLTIVEFLRDHLVPKVMANDPHELRLAHEAKNMVLNSEMILRASLFRTESRGVHYREDYPRREDPEWLAWTKIRSENGRMKVTKEPVPKEWWPDLTIPYEERYPLRFPGE